MFRFAAPLLLTIVFVVPARAESTAYSDGLSDRQAYEVWFDSLSTDEKAGAIYWAGQRSLPHPGACGHTDAPRDVGCKAAQRRLAPVDARRRSEPEY